MEAFTAGLPSTVTRPAAINRAACVRDRTSPRSAIAASSRTPINDRASSATVVRALEHCLQLLVDLRERLSARFERLVLDESHAREQLVLAVVSRIAHAHEYSS